MDDYIKLLPLVAAEARRKFGGKNPRRKTLVKVAKQLGHLDLARWLDETTPEKVARERYR